MKLLGFALCFAGSSISPAAAGPQEQPPVSYQLQIQPSRERSGIEVTGTFREPRNRETEFGVLVNYGR